MFSLSWSQTAWAGGHKRSQKKDFEVPSPKKTHWETIVTPETFMKGTKQPTTVKASKFKNAPNELFMAIQYRDGQWGVEQYLKGSKARELIIDPQSNNTALHEATKFQHGPELVKTLLMSDYAHLLIKPNNAGNTPLHTAIKYENWNVVSELLNSNHAFTLLSANNDGDTPLHTLARRIARKNGDWETVKYHMGRAYAPTLFFKKNKNNETAIQLFYSLKSEHCQNKTPKNTPPLQKSLSAPPISQEYRAPLSLSSPSHQKNNNFNALINNNNNTHSIPAKTSETHQNKALITKSISSQSNILTNKDKNNKAPLQCIIDKKYINNTYTSLPLIRTNNQHNTLQDFFSYSLTTLAHRPNYQDQEVHEHPIAQGRLSLLSTNKALIGAHERITFVRVGRNHNALVPIESDGGRIILVFTQSEQDLAYKFITDKQDVLLIQSLPKIEDESDLVLAGARWLAIFMAAYELKLENFMIMDDNIQSIHTKNIQIKHWGDIYSTYKGAAAINDYAIISSSSFRPEQSETMLNSDALEINTTNYGYKIFYINNTLLQRAIPEYLHLIPEDPRWPLQDIFFQEIARQADLKIGKISYNSLVLKRSNFYKNTCARSYKKRKISAEKWLETSLPPGTPDFYKNAYRAMKLIVENSLNYYHRNEEKVKNTPLADISRRIENNNRAYTNSAPRSESRTKYSSEKKPKKDPQLLLEITKNNVNIKNLILDALDNIFEDDENFSKLRNPQQEALFAFSTFLSEHASFQGFFDIATGIGKTSIFTLLAHTLRNELENTRVKSNKPHILIVTPSLEIDRQTFNERLLSENTIVIDAHHISYKVLLENNLFNKNNATPQIVIMCKNSLNELLSDTEHNRLLNKFSAIIFDEMHSFSEKILKVVKNYSDKSETLMLGFSATPKKTKNYFGTKPIFRYTAHQGVDAGLLLPWEIRPIKDNAFIDIESTKNTIKNILNELFITTNNNHRGIIWVDTIPTANILADYITTSMTSMNVIARPYHSQLSMEQRASLVEELNTGAINLLVAVRTLKEGLNCPAVNVAIFAKKKITLQDFIQMRGRALRKTTGKEERALIYLNKNTLTSFKEAKIYYTSSTQNPPSDDPAHVLDPAHWKVVPFPIHTDLEKALKYSVRFYRQDALHNIFQTINSSIYKSDNFRAEREKMRWKLNYHNYSDINKLYHQYFIVHAEDNSNNLIPAAHIYKEKYNNNDTNFHYQYIETIGEKSEERPILILKKKREVINNATEQTVWVDHYELLYNFGG